MFYSIKRQEDNKAYNILRYSVSNISLWCTSVSKPAPNADKRSEVAIVWMQWYTVITIPAVEYGFLGASGNLSGLVKWGLRVVCFPDSMGI